MRTKNPKETTGTCKKKNHCKVCNKTIVGSSYKFNSHLYQHNATKARFKCTTCNKTYFRSDVYKKHMSTHEKIPNRKYFCCDYCERGFIDKRCLVRHLSIHDDSYKPATPHKCTVCGISYSERRILYNHVRKYHCSTQQYQPIHAKKPLNETWFEKVLKTKECVEMRKLNNNVISIKKCGKIKLDPDLKCEVPKKLKNDSKDDKLTHYSKVICDYCNKEMLKKSLPAHIRERHFNQRKFKCDVCLSTFKRHYQIVDHVCGKFKPKGKYNYLDKINNK